MRTALTLSPDQFAFLASVVRYRGDAVQPHGERFVWQDSTTPRTDKPIRIGRLATCGLVITYRR